MYKLEVMDTCPWVRVFVCDGVIFMYHADAQDRQEELLEWGEIHEIVVKDICLSRSSVRGQ